jgi:hypothetical protein
MRKCIVIFLCLLCSCSAKSEKTNLKSRIIGKTYSDARELGVTEGKTSELIPNSDYCVHWVTFDSTNVVLLCKVDRSKNKNNPEYIISDCLILPKMNDSLDFAIRGCNQNTNEGKYIIAILHHNEENINKNIMKAWDANTTKGKIEEISPEGIECENPNPNLD